MDLVSLNQARKYTRKKVAPAYATAMFNPAIDIVYDSCYRDVTEPLDVYANDIKTDSGHSWERVIVGNATPELQYLPGGGLRASTSGVSRYVDGEAASVVAGFESERPYIKVRARNNWVDYDSRYYFVKWINADNWLAIRTSQLKIDVVINVEGTKTTLASTTSDSSSITDFHSSSLYTIEGYIFTTHPNTAPSGRFLKTVVNTTVLNVPLGVEQWSAIEGPGTVGWSIGSLFGSDIYGFLAGRGESS